jgi:CheY-like chemotaxis protein
MNPLILIVDSDSEWRQLLTFHLRHQGYHVVEAPSLLAAIELAYGHAQTVSFLDLRLSPGEGWQTLGTFLSHPTFAACPLIVASADAITIQRLVQSLGNQTAPVSL